MPCREVVPLATSGVRWSPDAHKAFPLRLRAAARALLLANHRGLTGAAEGTGAGVHLPPEVLLLILKQAAHPPAAWVPALQPGQLDMGDSLSSKIGRAAEQVFLERPSARRVGLVLVVAVVGVLVLGHWRRRRGAKRGMAPDV